MTDSVEVFKQRRCPDRITFVHGSVAFRTGATVEFLLQIGWLWAAAGSCKLPGLHGLFRNGRCRPPVRRRCQRAPMAASGAKNAPLEHGLPVRLNSCTFVQNFIEQLDSLSRLELLSAHAAMDAHMVGPDRRRNAVASSAFSFCGAKAARDTCTAHCRSSRQS